MCTSNERIKNIIIIILYLLNDCTPTQPSEKQDLVIGFLAGYGYSKVKLILKCRYMRKKFLN